MTRILLALALLAATVPLVASAQSSPPQDDVMVHFDTSQTTPRYIPGTAVPVTVAPGGLVQLMLFGKGPAHSLTLDGMDGYSADVAASTTEGFYERVAQFRAPMVPGSYPFHDKYDPNAKGLLVVQSKDAPIAEIGVGQGYDTRYYPMRLEVDAGATVRFMNNNTQIIHTLTAEDGSFDADAVTAGTSKTFTAPTKAGEYPFYCKYHKDSGMVGVLVVKATNVTLTSPSTKGASPTPASQDAKSTPGFEAPLLVAGIVGVALALRSAGRRR